MIEIVTTLKASASSFRIGAPFCDINHQRDPLARLGFTPRI